MDLSYFKKINNAFGTHNLRDSQLYNMRKYIENSFDKSIDYHEIELRDGSSQGVLITKTKDFSKKLYFQNHLKIYHWVRVLNGMVIIG